MRAFVAVDVPVPALGPAFGTPDAPVHLTLAFLGEVDDARVPALVGALRAALAGITAFPLTARGVGAFPSPRRPRIVWVGVREGAEELIRLAERIRQALTDGGFFFDAKPFVPHATVLRVKRPADRALAAALLARPPGELLGETRVTAVELKASRLSTAGAAHSVVARIPLEEPPG